MVWAGPGTAPETQIVVPFDRTQANAERLFRRLAGAGRIDAGLHARAWEMVRDNAWLTRPDGWKPSLSECLHDHEVQGRALLFPETVAVLALLSNPRNIERWVVLTSAQLREDIARMLPPATGPADVLVERIVLWLRRFRREIRPTRIDPLDVPQDIVNTAAIIDVTATYPLWIQRNPRAIGEWDWRRNEETRDPWSSRGTSLKASWTCDAGHAWKTTPYVRTLAGCPYCAGQSAWLGESDLATQFPGLAAEWDYTPGANSGDPSHANSRSNRRVSWICGRGHRWVTAIYNRTRNGSGCPYCAGKRIIPGETDLVTRRPDLAAEWDYSRNGPRDPHTLGSKSAAKVWWEGPCGHHWQALISNRSKGMGCPYCGRKRALPGETDLATVRPDLAAEWHHSNQLSPTDVLPNSGRKVTWQCAEGHLWNAIVISRSKGRGCPYCSGKLVIPGKTDLATIRPDIATEWDSSNSLTAQEVTAHSDRLATWKCRAGHVWQAVVSNRTGRRRVGCPYCSGHRAIPGQTDLRTLRPDLAAEWDISNTRPPDHAKPTSTFKVAWRCARGHVWEATPRHRSQGHGCPHCAPK
ncbi:zinc-ribbon domain-containing protein [Leifsonia soli]